MKRWELESAYARERERNAELTRRIGELEAELAALRAEVGPLKEMVAELQKLAYRQAGRFRRDPDRLAKGKKPSGRRAGEGEWSRPAEPTEEQKAKAVDKASDLAACPNCSDPLTDWQDHVHYEWDIPPVVPVLTSFKSRSGYCARCKRRHRSRHLDQISEATGAAGVIVGPRAKALASDMKHYFGVSYGKISAFLETVYGMQFGRGGLYRADMRLATRAGPVYVELIELVRRLAQVHVDETGWRIGTLSAWLWVFCGSDVTVYTIKRSRGHQMVLEILGQQFQGRLTTDGLLTYDAAALDAWLKQKCMAHILRRLKEMSASAQATHRALATGTSAVLREALALARTRTGADDRSYAEAAAAIEVRLDALLVEHISDANDDAARMARHLTKHRAALLPFLYHDGIEPTNNSAEQALRPAVITRKVGGCNRTVEGAHAHAVLASLGATCRSRGIPVLDFFVQILRATTAPPTIAAATLTAAD